MSLYVLDTDILSLYQSSNMTVAKHVFDHASNELAVTIISVEEQLRAWFTLRRRARKAPEIAYAYDRFGRSITSLAPMTILSFTEPAIARFEHSARQSWV